ncbi:transglutaminase elicitor, putative [Phytophthora infestans T30-4]|uniref:Transglutaminase elicitor, putative n=1 Tax=Phytophthora infestans (strain T30-4) TaxID=403677 RepID=D0NUG8_PHYIT|nr:transglutaminase elicitor, putative [Phytophthora infestans T30-4]EEY65314.1 transglutaminase elicitor, putative [Phytophthora infestans T30-4]|eukprot:XP_002897177.1 transglutaminase elicitor, putative [Phytophthora infestans T30-4]
MVYKLRRYLISAAAALVAMQMQQVSCTSLFYDPVTSANTTDEISSKFPARGGQVTDQDCAITVEVDPTLPDITTISTVTVTYTELLANTSTAPTEAVSTLVGKAVLCETIPATDANQDAYTTTTTTSTSTSTTQSTQSSTTSSSGGKTTHTKSGTTVSQTSTSTSTTTSTKTGININPSASSSVAGSSAEETTSTTKTGVTTAPSTSSSSMAGSLAEETNLTISPSTKTGVTTAPTTSTSVAGSSNVETTATASPPKTGVTTTTAAPSADETSSSTNIEVTTAPTAPSTSYSSVAGSSTEDAKSTSAPSTKTGVTSAPTTSLDVAGSSDVETSATASPTKTGVVTPPTAPSVDDASKEEPNCATGWEEESSRKLRHSPMSGRRLEEKFEKKRQLEANTNKDIAKLEAYFGTSMESTLAHLPTVGVHTPSPWPGPYWPTYQDSINVIWSAGEPSPAEKYATAFGLDVDDFMNKVSADNGVDSMSSRTVCSSDSDCSSLTDGSSCAIRAGKSSGYCIPTWFGICHAWAPAAMIEEEPKCAVTHNGVTFQPMDLKALISDVYDGASVSTVFTGTRFNGGTDSTDEYGRHSSDAYRDLNPAYFHIAASNLLGKLNATFVADVTAGAEVWNQPVRGFKVYEQTEMTLEEAAQTFYGLEEYPWNAAAKSIVYVKTRLSWIFETYTDGGLVSSGKGGLVHDRCLLHVPAGDGRRRSNHRRIGLSYGDVAMLLEKSVACTGSSSGSVDAGSSVSASASASASTLGSVGASTSGSTASLSLPGSDSTGSAPFTSSGTSSTGSEDAATVVPVTEAPVATETPVATQTSTDTSTTTPVSTTATPATTTATPSSNQGSNPYWNGNGGNQGSNQHWSGHWGDNDSDDSQQDHSWLSWLHW